MGYSVPTTVGAAEEGPEDGRTVGQTLTGRVEGLQLGRPVLGVTVGATEGVRDGLIDGDELPVAPEALRKPPSVKAGKSGEPELYGEDE